PRLRARETPAGGWRRMRIPGKARKATATVSSREPSSTKTTSSGLWVWRRTLSRVSPIVRPAFRAGMTTLIVAFNRPPLGDVDLVDRVDQQQFLQVLEAGKGGSFPPGRRLQIVGPAGFPRRPQDLLAKEFSEEAGDRLARVPAP